MTEQHPLTDEMCKQIQLHIFNQTDEDCMRAAADWQLDCDVEFFKSFLVASLGISPATAASMGQDFKAAMRLKKSNS